jgi:hypothetical protein
MWHAINKEVGKSLKYEKIDLKRGIKIKSNPQTEVDKLNTYYRNN